MADRFEEDRVAGRAIARVGLVIFIVLAASLLLLGALAHYYRVMRPGNPASYAIPAPPRIDPAQHSELERYLAEQQGRLEGYAWVDRDRGWAHIPIERAMALYAAPPNQGEGP